MQRTASKNATKHAFSHSRLRCTPSEKIRCSKSTSQISALRHFWLFGTETSVVELALYPFTLFSLVSLTCEYWLWMTCYGIYIELCYKIYVFYFMFICSANPIDWGWFIHGLSGESLWKVVPKHQEEEENEAECRTLVLHVARQGIYIAIFLALQTAKIRKADIAREPQWCAETVKSCGSFIPGGRCGVNASKPAANSTLSRHWRWEKYIHKITSTIPRREIHTSIYFWLLLVLYVIIISHIPTVGYLSNFN